MYIEQHLKALIPIVLLCRGFVIQLFAVTDHFSELLPAGWLPVSKLASLGIYSQFSLRTRCNTQRICLQTPVQESCLFFPGRKWIHIWSVSWTVNSYVVLRQTYWLSFTGFFWGPTFGTDLLNPVYPNNAVSCPTTSSTR